MPSASTRLDRPLLRALRPQPHRGDQVAAGVVVLATLVLLVDVRFAAAWGAGARLLVTALATAFIGTMAVLSPVDAREHGPRAYQTVLYVTTCLLLVLTLGEFDDLLGARPLSAGALTWITLLGGLAALAFARLRDSSYCTLVAAILLAIALQAAVAWIFDPDGVTASRWVLLLTAVAAGVGAVMLRDRKRRHAVMLIDAVGLAVLALAATDLLTTGLLGGAGSTLPWGWLLVVFAAGSGLVAYAGADREPGPGYLGVSVLIAFAVLAGRGSGDATLVGWPLVLFVIAAAFLAIGLRPSRPLPPEPGVEDVPLPPETVPLPPRERGDGRRGGAPQPPAGDGSPTDEF